MKTISKLTQEDIDFLNEQNSPERGTPLYLTAQHGYIRNLDHSVKQQFENIYRRVIDKNFALDYYCTSCDHLLKAVINLYEVLEETTGEPLPVEEVTTETPQPEVTEQPEPQAEIPPVTLGETPEGEEITETIDVPEHPVADPESPEAQPKKKGKSK